jgi:hypothetical protein
MAPVLRALDRTKLVRLVTGQREPEKALDQTYREVRRIFQKWKERGMV